MQVPTGMLWGNARVVEIVRMLRLVLGGVARHSKHTASAPRNQHSYSAAAQPEANAQEEILAHAQRAGEQPPPPWSFLVQHNERHLKWESDARVQLIIKVLSERLDMTTPEVAARLEMLAQLIPDLSPKMGYTKTDILLLLITDLPGLAVKLLRLKELLPGLNVSMLVSRVPALLLGWETGVLAARLREMRSDEPVTPDTQLLPPRLDSCLSTQLPGVNVAMLIDAEPAVLTADLHKVLAHCRRLLPDEDPVRVLVTRPQMVLDMQEAGMPSALDVEGFSPRQ
ncbi:MAG: hypothetical protein WDW38_005903 [Sanguina aurantia]